MQAHATMMLPTQKRSADGRIGRSPIPDPSRARRRGPDPVQRGRTHRGAHGEGRAHPPAASPSPRSAPSSRNGPAPSAPDAASSSAAPGPSPARRKQLHPFAREGPARLAGTPPTGGAGSTTWPPAGPDADPCGDAPSRPGPRRLRPDPRVHAPPPPAATSRAEPTRQTRPSCPASRTKHGPAPPTPPNSTPMPQDATLRTGHDQRAPQTRPISPAARRPRHRHPPAGSAPPNTSTHTRRPTCASPDTHH